MPILKPKGNREYAYTVSNGKVYEHVLVRENEKSFLVVSERNNQRNVNFVKNGFHFCIMKGHPSYRVDDQVFATKNPVTAVIFAKYQCRFTNYYFKFTPSGYRTKVV